MAVFLTPAQAKELAGDKQFIEVMQDGYRFSWLRTSHSMQVWRADAPSADEPLETFTIPPWLDVWTMDVHAVRATATMWLTKRSEA